MPPHSSRRWQARGPVVGQTVAVTEPLPPGLYEVLVTEALADQLTAIEDRLVVRADGVRPAEVADRVALHLSRVVERAIDGVTEAWSIHLVASAGPHPGAIRPRLWLALYAPNTPPGMLLAAREQEAEIAALPEATQAALREARPVPSTPGAWRWLQVGRAVELPRGFSADDDARRVVARCVATFGAHLAALAARSRDRDRWLYSCDRDDMLFRPTDAVDRRALATAARPDAERVLLVATQPGEHPAGVGTGNPPPTEGSFGIRERRSVAGTGHPVCRTAGMGRGRFSLAGRECDRHPRGFACGAARRVPE